MTVEQAIRNALSLLEALGYTGGDVHDDLAAARMALSSPDARPQRMLTEGTYVPADLHLTPIDYAAAGVPVPE